MQATTVAPSPAPAPAAPEAQAQVPATITFTGADGKTQALPIPMTSQAIRDIRAQREELSDQLISASSRRRNLASQLANTPPGPARSGLEQRIMVLDQRLAQIESDIAATGKQLSAAPLGTTAGMGDPFRGGDMPDNVAAVTAAFTFLVLFPIAIAFARRIWKRGSSPSAQQAQLPAQIDQRLERLEQGIDAIAIEIERVTEGQRFVTRLLSESQPALKLPEERITVNRD
jgi:hypothetical protein